MPVITATMATGSGTTTPRLLAESGGEDRGGREGGEDRGGREGGEDKGRTREDRGRGRGKGGLNRCPLSP